MENKQLVAFGIGVIATCTVFYMTGERNEAVNPSVAGSNEQKVEGESATDGAESVGSLTQANETIEALRKENFRLYEELAEAKLATESLGSEVAFDYGTPKEAGAFVGRTFSALFETSDKKELSEVEDGFKSVEIDLLSLGPFIQEAEVFESDPIVFAQFQSSLVNEVLQLGPERQERLRNILVDFKNQAVDVPVGSDEWHEINQGAFASMERLLTKDERSELKDRIAFFSEHGMLIVPTYSILQ